MNPNNNIVDFHSHIIPGVDDGAKTIEESIEMLRAAADAGTSAIIATPHYFQRRNYETDFKEVRCKVKELRKAVFDNNINIKIYTGQEVGYSRDLLNLYKGNNLGTIAESKYMLIEFPLSGFSISEVIEDIYELQIKGIVPIIAHPERYRQFQKQPEEINKLIEEGFLFQLNIGSLTGDFGKESKRLAKLYVKHNIYSVFGSDAHSKDMRGTDMTSGCKELLKINSSYGKEMTRNAEQIIRNKEVKFKGSKIEIKKGLFSLFSR